MDLLKRFKEMYDDNPFIIDNLYYSDNAKHGTWPNENNYKLYGEIELL